MTREFYTYLIILESGVKTKHSTGEYYVYIKAGRAENAEKRYLNHLRGHSGDYSNVGMRILFIKHIIEDNGDENYFRAMMNYVEDEVAFRDDNNRRKYASPIGEGKQEFMIASPQVLGTIIQACINNSLDLMKEGVTIKSEVVYQEPVDKINNFINNVIYVQKTLEENTDSTMAFIDNAAETKYWSTYLDAFTEQLNDIYYLRLTNIKSVLETEDNKSQRVSSTYKLPPSKVKKKSHLPYIRFTDNKIEVVKSTEKQKRSGKTKQTATVIASKKKKKAETITFDLLQIPPGTEIEFRDGKNNIISFDCIVADSRRVYIKGDKSKKKYYMSQVLKLNPSPDRKSHSQSNSWRGPSAFYYKGRDLVDIAKNDFGWTGKG